MSDLEPASALASRVVGDLFDSTGERADVWRVEQLIESDRAAVREPLERRIAELEEQAEDDRRDFAEAAALDFPGGKPTREDLIEGLQGLVESHDAHVERIADLEVRAEKLGALVDSGADAMFSAADQRIGELEATVRQFVVAEKRFNDRIASLEAQLASAREEALREAIAAVEAINADHWATTGGIKARALMVLQSRISFVRNAPPAAQKEPL